MKKVQNLLDFHPKWRVKSFDDNGKLTTDRTYLAPKVRFEGDTFEGIFGVTGYQILGNATPVRVKVKNGIVTFKYSGGHQEWTV